MCDAFANTAQGATVKCSTAPGSGGSQPREINSSSSLEMRGAEARGEGSEREDDERAGVTHLSLLSTEGAVGMAQRGE